MKKNLIAVMFGILILSSFISQNIFAQEEESEEPEGYVFTIVKELPATSVKNQYRSGTC